MKFVVDAASKQLNDIGGLAVKTQARFQAWSKTGLVGKQPCIMPTYSRILHLCQTLLLRTLLLLVLLLLTLLLLLLLTLLLC